MIRQYLKENKTEILCTVPAVIFLDTVADIIFPGSLPVIVLTLTSLITTSKLYGFIKDNVI